MGFWRPGQEVESAPLFPDLKKKCKMVDPKLISVIFKSENKTKQNKTRRTKEKKSYIFAKFKVYTAPRAYKALKIVSLISLHFASINILILIDAKCKEIKEIPTIWHNLAREKLKLLSGQVEPNGGYNLLNTRSISAPP